jgi:hypothetical protein
VEVNSMNRNVRNQIFATTLVAVALSACTPFDKALPDGGDGATRTGSGGAAGTAPGAAGGGGAAGSAVNGAGGAAGNNAAGGGVAGGTAGTIAGGAGAPAGGNAGSQMDGGSDASGDVAPESTPTGPDLKMMGALCTKSTECASGFCADGVCCSTVCDQSCMACSTDKTGSATGTCAPVKAGMPHANDCVAADPTTCGHDGKCDGAGACRNFASGTPCASESCADGASVSNYSSARTCDGHGVCTAPTTSTCGAVYRCTATKCRTTCAGAQDCVPAAYCAGSTCVAKKADGEPCSSAMECAKGVCGGLCCAAGCTCTQPSPANVLKNSGIDKDTSGWTIDSGMLSRSLSDAERCPYSGSLTTTIEAGGAARLVSQCVSNTPLSGTYNFGARVKTDRGTGGQNILCEVTFFSGFNCDADAVVDNETNATAAHLEVWEATTPESFPDGTPVSGANSVLFSCHLLSDPQAATDYSLDMLYVSKAPARF